MAIQAMGGISVAAPQDSLAVWVISPHLLVAQAVAEGLRSAGVSVQTASWEEVIVDAHQDSTQTARLAGGHVVVILDEFDAAFVEQISRLLEAGPDRVMVVTSGTRAAWWGALLVTDAVEVLTMARSVEQLANLVGQFIKGESLTEPDERRKLQAAWADAMDTRRRTANLMATLTPQQRRILELLATGRRVSEVGVLIGVTSGTVRSHVKALRARLGAASQLEAVAMLHQLHEVGDVADLLPRPRGTPADEERVTSRR